LGSTWGRVSIAAADSVWMHSAQVSSLMALPAAEMRRVSAATPTAARLWCGRLHTAKLVVGSTANSPCMRLPDMG
jgi:hypothetical protein